VAECASVSQTKLRRQFAMPPTAANYIRQDYDKIWFKRSQRDAKMQCNL